MQCERKIQDKQNKFRKVIARKQKFWPQFIQIIQDYIYCPRHEVTMGFSTVCTERVIQFSRPDGRSYWTLRRRDWIFPITTRSPTLRCKTEVSRAMEPLDQDGSRTSLQDGNLACKWNPLSRTYDTLERALAHLTKNPTGRHLRHSC